jgi:hypothetical protein
MERNASRFHFAATASFTYLVVTFRGVDNGTVCPTSQVRKDFGERLQLTRGVGEPSISFEKRQKLLQMLVIK